MIERLEVDYPFVWLRLCNHDLTDEEGVDHPCVLGVFPQHVERFLGFQSKA